MQAKECRRSVTEQRHQNQNFITLFLLTLLTPYILTDWSQGKKKMSMCVTRT